MGLFLSKLIENKCQSVLIKINGIGLRIQVALNYWLICLCLLIDFLTIRFVLRRNGGEHIVSKQKNYVICDWKYCSLQIFNFDTVTG